MANKKSRKALATRASNLRRAQKAGKTLTQKQEAELAEWEAMKQPNYGPHKPASNAPMKKPEPKEGKLSSLDQTRTVPDAKPVSKARDESEPEPSAVQQSLTPEPPPEVLSKSGKVDKDWRTKYGSDQMSREALCTMAGKAWISGLKKMNKQIAEQEQKPFLNDDFLDSEIYNACVLTVDHVLPNDLEVTPQVTAAAGTTVVLAQRVTVGFIGKKKRKEEKPRLEVVKDAETPKVVEKKEKAEVDREKRRIVDTSYTPKPEDAY